MRINVPYRITARGKSIEASEIRRQARCDPLSRDRSISEGWASAQAGIKDEWRREKFRTALIISFDFLI